MKTSLAIAIFLYLSGIAAAEIDRRIKSKEAG